MFEINTSIIMFSLLVNVMRLLKLYSLDGLWFEISNLLSLKEEFSRRFSDFQTLDDQFVLLTVPFSYDIDKASTDLQLELYLQNDNIL